jgi:hypothetical protein
MRTRTPAIAGGIALAASLALAGCSTDDTPTSRAGDTSTSRRGTVSLKDSEAVASGPRSVNVTVPSCNGEPVVDELVEDGEAVRLRIVTTVTNPGDGCLDSLEIELEEPLGGRPLIDMTSGTELQVRS